jgi:2OG-Fe(II) oxygenase superfamily
MPGQPLTVRPLPFPHLAADGLWDADLLRRVAAEFPDPAVPGWRRYENSTERKLEGPPGLWGPATRELFARIEARTGTLGEAFGISGLQMETVGGGYHLIPPGGYLAVHADFNRSPHTGRYRRLNHLIYLNDGWDEAGGALELWDGSGPAVTVAPELNRTVVFETSDHSWHGHPEPAARWRKSVAAYFFTADPPDGYAGEHSTLWHEQAARA